MNNEDNKNFLNGESNSSKSEYFTAYTSDASDKDNGPASSSDRSEDLKQEVNEITESIPANNSSSDQNGKEDKRNKRKSSQGFFLKAISLVLIAVLAGGASGAGAYLLLEKYDSDTPPTVDVPNVDLPSVDLTVNDSGSAGEGVITSVTKVVEAVMPAMVSINVTATTTITGMWGQTQEYEVQGSGSGIVISQSDTTLFLATNHHVIDNAKKISVTFIDGKSYEASLKGSDSDYDLAVISIPLAGIEEDTLSAIRCAVLGSSENLNLGEPAIAIGNALGYGQSVTVGYISATEREVQMEDKTMVLIQTDAAINPGNSGGALLNINGELIGINSSKYADTNVEGMGFAIPISDAVPIINEIINETAIPDDEQAYLGITGGTVNSSWISVYGWPEGVYISAVTKDSPADKGGIRAHDIIIKFEGKTVQTIDSLTSRLGKKRAGDTVEITVMRQNNYGEFEEKTLSVTLGSKKDA